MRKMFSLKQIKEIADSRVQSLVESGSLENAKPIYCHPISIDYEGGDVTNPVHIACLIFDNSNEEYNTYAKFNAKLNEIFAINPLAVFPITGAMYYASGSALHIAQKIEKHEGENSIRTVRPNGSQGYFLVSTYLVNASFYDGVNKIN